MITLRPESYHYAVGRGDTGALSSVQHENLMFI